MQPAGERAGQGGAAIATANNPSLSILWLMSNLQESVRVKVVRRALEQLNSAMRQHKGMAKNPMSGSLMAAVSAGAGCILF
jgi:hypothetical protein